MLCVACVLVLAVFSAICFCLEGVGWSMFAVICCIWWFRFLACFPSALSTSKLCANQELSYWKLLHFTMSLPTSNIIRLRDGLDPKRLAGIPFIKDIVYLELPRHHLPHFPFSILAGSCISESWQTYIRNDCVKACANVFNDFAVVSLWLSSDLV
jgi:hypothetical protein